jgi:hypothetical protein
LQPEKVVETVEVLSRRIRERFPDSGLYRVATELQRIADEAAERARRIRQPNVPLRFGVIVLVGLVAAVVWRLVHYLRLNEAMFQLENFIQTLEAALGSFVFIGAAIVFLFSLEMRIKRARALDAVRELRSLAHIIDMHQLTKDPERVTGRGAATKSSPKRTMTPFELGRYLDYCSELLSLVSKTGAIYVQEFPDPTAIEAVDRLASMTTDLSRNIWQKIMILETTVGASDSMPPPVAPLPYGATSTDGQPKSTPASPRVPID